VQSADPSEPTYYNGTLVTGTPPAFCNPGDVGCTCRQTTASSLCDQPYTCDDLGYCVLPACPAGAAGCPANADGSCNDATLANQNNFCVTKPVCTAGSIGCTCAASATCSAGQCLDGECIYATNTTTAPCTPGTAGCPCNADGTCGGTATCDSTSGVCLYEACAPGQGGCACATTGASCTIGFQCSNGACVALGCTPGDKGCTCLTGGKCNLNGYSCVDLDRDGKNTMCVGEQLCGIDQTARCNLECGIGNIAACGNCTYSTPVCQDPTYQYCNPKSYLYMVQPCPTISASTVAMSVFAAITAVVALF